MTPAPRQFTPSKPLAGTTTAGGSTTADRFSRRQWQRRLATLRPLLIVVGGIVLALVAGWILVGSSWLTAQQVTVAGERSISQRQVLAAAKVEIGTPLVRLDLDAIRRRVAALRPVASVNVHRAWPNTVAITVTERQPVAAVSDMRGGWDLVDKSGVVFRHASSRVALPVIDVASTGDVAALHAAASVVTSLPAHLLSKVRQLRAETMDSLTLQLTDGREVRWGSAEENAEKVKVLTVLLEQPAHIYDVSVPAQPTTAK